MSQSQESRDTSQDSVELVLQGYRAFLAGDFEAIADMLDPDVEWSGLDGGPWDHAGQENVLEVLADRLQDGFRIELERCIGVGDKVVVSFRASGVEKDAADPRPLQSRRYFTVGRYSGIVTTHDGRVVHVQDYPHLSAALEAVGLEEEAH
jgi:ketosteroid isomerase-like protein